MPTAPVALLLVCFGMARAQAGPSPILVSPPRVPFPPPTRAAQVKAVQPVPTGPPQALAGRVLSATDKHPLANATVDLTDQQTGRVVVTVRTDADGRYRFVPQPAGRYALRASATGYLGQMYLEHESFSSAIILGQGLATEHLDLELTPSASIHGRVLDEAGEPVQRANVTLYRENAASAADSTTTKASRIRRAGGTQVDDDGRYELPNLQPGRYYVTVNATPWYSVHPQDEAENAYVSYRTAIDPALDVIYPETFYPGSIVEDGARPIELRAGQRATANLNLVPQHGVNVQIRMPTSQAGPGGQMVNYPVLSRTVFGSEESANPQFTTPAGTDRSVLTARGLAPGNYHVRQFGQRGQTSTESEVAIGPGVSTVDLSAGAPPGSVHVHLQTQDGNALPEKTFVNAIQPLGRRVNNSAPVKDGVAEFAELAPGDYRFVVGAAGAHWYVLRASADGKPVRSASVAVASGGSTSVDLLLTRYEPSLRGIALAADHKPLVGAMAVLVPAGADAAEDLFRRDQTDLDGGYTFTGVAPGNYLLLLLENAWKLRWNDPATLEPYLLQATPIIVPTAGPRQVEITDGVKVQPLR